MDQRLPPGRPLYSAAASPEGSDRCSRLLNRCGRDGESVKKSVREAGADGGGMRPAPPSSDDRFDDRATSNDSRRNESIVRPMSSSSSWRADEL